MNGKWQKKWQIEKKNVIDNEKCTFRAKKVLKYNVSLRKDESLYLDLDQFGLEQGFIKGRAVGKLTGCERDLAITLPGCFRLLFLLSCIRKTKNAQLKNLTDLLHKNLMKPLLELYSWFPHFFQSK